MRGHIIDFWGHKIPNVPVQIGDTLVSTDDNGAFTIPNVAATYDVSTAFDLDPDANISSFGWVFEGLTRRDPTLAGDSRAVAARGQDIKQRPKTRPSPSIKTIRLSVGGVDGNTYLGDIGMGGIQETLLDWEGGPTSQQMAHGLYMQFDAASELPTKYFKYDSSLVALAETGTAQISLDMTKGTIVSDNLQGTATTGGGSDRKNQVFLRFASGAVMGLVNDDPGPNTFSYLVPTVPTSSISVAASEGFDSYLGPYAVAHLDGLTGSSKPALQNSRRRSRSLSPADSTTGITSKRPSSPSPAPPRIQVHSSSAS